MPAERGDNCQQSNSPATSMADAISIMFSSGNEPTQFTFRNTKTREATTQTQQQLGKNQNSSLIQTCTSGEVKVNFRVYLIVVG